MKLCFRTREKVLRCSFCNLSQRDVKLLISGPNVYICDQCVDICLGMIEEQKAKEAEVPAQTEVPT